MKIIANILCLALVLIGLQVNAIAAPVINAGSDQYGILINQKIILNGQVSGFASYCSLSYSWVRNGGTGAPITIYNSTSLTGAYFYGPSETVGGQNIYVDLVVTASGCPQAGTHTDSVTYSVDPYFLNVVANEDLTVTAGSSINLSGQKYGAVRSCTSPSYQRTQTGTILTPDLFDESSSNAKSTSFSFTAPSPTSDTIFKVEFVVTCPGETKKDIVNITVQGSGVGRGTSVSQAGTQQADNTFSSINLNNIKIILSQNELMKGPAIMLNWNKIGEEGIVNYELEISKSKSFDNSSSTKLISNSAYLIKKELFENSSIVFVRVRAVYKGTYSPYSNTLMLYDEEDLLNKIKFILKRYKKINLNNLLIENNKKSNITSTINDINDINLTINATTTR